MEIKRDLEFAIGLDPNSAEGYYWLSASYFDEKEQIEKLTRAIERDPNSGRYYYRRSQLREKLHLEGVKSADTSSMHEGKIRLPEEELRAQARQRGRQRVNDAAQSDFDRALELGYEEAVAEKNYKEPSFSFDIEPFGPKYSILNELLKPKK